MKTSVWYCIVLSNRAHVLGNRSAYENRTLFDYVLSMIKPDQVEENREVLDLIKIDEMSARMQAPKRLNVGEEKLLDNVDYSKVVFTIENFNKNFEIYEGRGLDNSDSL